MTDKEKQALNTVNRELKLMMIKAEATTKLAAIKELVDEIEQLLADPPSVEIREFDPEERLRSIERYRINRYNF